MNIITPTELLSKINSGSKTVFIDVRTPAEYETAHIAGSINLPLNSNQLENFINQQKGKEDIVYVTCQKGGRAKTACLELEKLNIPFMSLEGGVDNWINAKLPIVEGKKTISLERQVRIAAGLLVLIGVFLHYSGFTNAILLSAFVGAGLIFAGVTDTCGMANILYYMPWNKGNKNSGSSCAI